MSARKGILSIPTRSFPASHQDTVGVVGTKNKHTNSYFRSLPSQQARRHDGMISVTSPGQKERINVSRHSSKQYIIQTESTSSVFLISWKSEENTPRN